jgi:membrane fusion protein (multidrug efflux system)
MVQDYDSVSTNQFLAELDDAELQSQLAEMEADSVQTDADIASAKAAVQNALVSLKVNKGNIEVSNVKLQQAANDYNRNKNLFADQAITQKQLDDSKYNSQTAQKTYENFQNDLTSAESKIPVLESMVKKNEAVSKLKCTKIAETKLKLSYTKIYAPSSGKIGKKNITVGQFVQAGAPLFSIVNDSTYWVTANFKEDQIKNLFIGKEVELRIDAFPDEKITGIIESISDATGAKFALLPPDNSSGNFVKVTQRIPVKIKINNLEKYKPVLRAGLSVFVSATIK